MPPLVRSQRHPPVGIAVLSSEFTRRSLAQDECVLQATGDNGHQIAHLALTGGYLHHPHQAQVPLAAAGPQFSRPRSGSQAKQRTRKNRPLSARKFGGRSCKFFSAPAG